MKAITSVKDAFESDSVIITKISQGNRSNVRVDARTRFPIPDKDNFFSKWVSYSYANRLALSTYGKKLTDLRAFNY